MSDGRSVEHFRAQLTMLGSICVLLLGLMQPNKQP